MEHKHSDCSDVQPSPPPPDPDRTSLLAQLNIQEKLRERGRAEFNMLVEDRHLRTLGILHGGVTATLLDTAMGMAAGTLSPADHFVVTVQLNVNYIRPAWKGETLVATGEIVHSGMKTAVGRGEIRTSENTLVATGTATFMHVRYPSDDRNQLSRHKDED